MAIFYLSFLSWARGKIDLALIFGIFGISGILLSQKIAS
jgi:hypothetical protein